MASYKSKFITVILIVFYSMMNLDNAKCPSLQEYNQCKIHMKKYCGENLTDVLNCAKHAILEYNMPRDEDNPSGSSDEDVASNFPSDVDVYYQETPEYIIQYFNDYVSPYIITTGVQSTEQFCDDIECNNDQDLSNWFGSLIGVFRADKISERTIAICNDFLELIKGLPVQDLIIKDKKFNRHMVIYVYLKVFSAQIELDVTKPGERKTPEEFCQSHEHNY